MKLNEVRKFVWKILLRNCKERTWRLEINEFKEFLDLIHADFVDLIRRLVSSTHYARAPKFVQTPRQHSSDFDRSMTKDYIYMILLPHLRFLKERPRRCFGLFSFGTWQECGNTPTTEISLPARLALPGSESRSSHSARALPLCILTPRYASSSRSRDMNLVETTRRSFLPSSSLSWRGVSTRATSP